MAVAGGDQFRPEIQQRENKYRSLDRQRPEFAEVLSTSLNSFSPPSLIPGLQKSHYPA